MTLKNPFKTSHPWLTVVPHERATELLKTAGEHVSGLLSVADPPPWEAKRPPKDVVDYWFEVRGSGTGNTTLYEQLAFRDIANFDPDCTQCAEPVHVERALRFARAWRACVGTQQGARMVVHCQAGRSRSTALAFAMLCAELGPGKEQEAMDQLLKACERTPLPNARVCKLADDYLGRRGRLLAVAVEQNDRPRDAEADALKPVTGTALLAAIRRGEL